MKEKKNYIHFLSLSVLLTYVSQPSFGLAFPVVHVSSTLVFMDMVPSFLSREIQLLFIQTSLSIHGNDQDSDHRATPQGSIKKSSSVASDCNL